MSHDSSEQAPTATTAVTTDSAAAAAVDTAVGAGATDGGVTAAVSLESGDVEARSFWEQAGAWAVRRFTLIMTFLAIADAFLLGRLWRVIELRVGHASLYPTAMDVGPATYVLLGISGLIETMVLFSIFASVYGYAMKRKWALQLYYAQFPFRLVSMLTTFGFIMAVHRWAENAMLDLSWLLYAGLGLLVIAGEIARLHLTILLHCNWRRAQAELR